MDGWWQPARTQALLRLDLAFLVLGWQKALSEKELQKVSTGRVNLWEFSTAEWGNWGWKKRHCCSAIFNPIKAQNLGVRTQTRVISLQLLVKSKTHEHPRWRKCLQSSLWNKSLGRHKTAFSLSSSSSFQPPLGTKTFRQPCKAALLLLTQSGTMWQERKLFMLGLSLSVSENLKEQWFK